MQEMDYLQVQAAQIGDRRSGYSLQGPHRRLSRTQTEAQKTKKDILTIQQQVQWWKPKHLWTDTEDPDFVMDAASPNSCYARYANDPLDDNKCNAILKRIGTKYSS